jgi:hypothetical protein
LQLLHRGRCSSGLTDRENLTFTKLESEGLPQANSSWLSRRARLSAASGYRRAASAAHAFVSRHVSMARL